jgi:hypothetical protein
MATEAISIPSPLYMYLDHISGSKGHMATLLAHHCQHINNHIQNKVSLSMITEPERAEDSAKRRTDGRIDLLTNT